MTLQEITARKAELNKRKGAIADIAKRAAEGDAVSEDLSALTTEVDEIDVELRKLMAEELQIRSSADFKSVVQTPQATQNATEYETPRERAIRNLEAVEYKRALMAYMQRGTPIPAQFRADTNQITTSVDASAVIPISWANEIVKEAKTYGNIYPKCRQFNVQGGLRVPILSLKPTATWVNETTPSTTKKIQANSYVSFAYHTLECKISQTILVSATTLDAFQALFVQLAAEAMAKALDAAVISGEGAESGQPTGITVDSRVSSDNVVTLTDKEIKSWAAWKKKVFGKMKKSYQKGAFFMAQGTWDGYIDAMTDEVGQPIGRVTYGIADGPVYRFGGKLVETVEDDIINNFDAAEAGDVVAVFADLNNYGINSNMEMTIVKWVDHDTNEVKNKAMLIADGKLLDANGVIIVKKA